MRALPLLALGIAAYGAFLVAGIPAAVVAPRLAESTKGQATLANAEGSVWSGSGTLRVVHGGTALAIDRIEWSFAPSRLFLGEIAFDLKAASKDLSATAQAARSVGEWRVRDLAATAPASMADTFAPLAAAWQPGGTIAIDAPAFAFDGREFKGEARASWRDAALSLSPVRPLGTWTATVKGEGQKAAVALATDKGPLRLAGKGTLEANGRLVFDGEARAEPGRDKDLESLLALLGPRRADGAHALQLR